MLISYFDWITLLLTILFNSNECIAHANRTRTEVMHGHQGFILQRTSFKMSFLMVLRLHDMSSVFTSLKLILSFSSIRERLRALSRERLESRLVWKEYGFKYKVRFLYLTVTTV